MQIVSVGAGAVGSFVGAVLAAGGHDVAVAPDRLLLGLAIDLPGARRVFALNDVLRLVPDGDSSVEEVLRLLAEDPAVDPLNRVVFGATIMDQPFSIDPLYSRLPSETRGLLDIWSR